MMPKVDKYLLPIKAIISRYLDLNKHKLFLFGSRASGKAAKFADYDIGISGKTKIDADTLFKIKNDLDESDLPVFVDVVDFNDVSDKFKQVAFASVIEI